MCVYVCVCVFSRYDHRHHTSNRILFMPFKPLAHTYQ